MGGGRKEEVGVVDDVSSSKWNGRVTDLDNFTPRFPGGVHLHCDPASLRTWS